MLIGSRRAGTRKAASPRGRKVLLVSAATLAAALGATTAVSAQDNLLTIDGRGLPLGAGSPTRPLAKDLSFRAEVHPPGGVLPAPFERYRIVIQGGRVYPRVLPSCSVAKAAAADHARRCQSARVGTVANFIRPRLGGKAASGIEFTVPPELRHIAGLSIVVKSLTGKFRRVLGQARVAGTKRSVGYFSSVACANRSQRLVAVSAVDENGLSYRASARVPC